MTTINQIIYFIKDLCKINTDDSYFTNEHILFSISKYRNMLLKQNYNTIKKEIEASNYSNICVDLIKEKGNEFTNCNKIFLKSTKKIPNILNIGKISIYPTDIYSNLSYINMISYERMKFVGNNKYMKNIIYASIAPNNYLYLISNNSSFLNLEKLKINAIFENIEDIINNNCNNNCNDNDISFPLEENLIPLLIQNVVKDFTQEINIPEDKENNTNDDTSIKNLNGSEQQ